MARSAPSSTLGVFASLLASALFAGMFYLAGRADASGELLFAWRTIAIPLCYAPLLAFPLGRRALAGVWTRLTSRWWMPLGLAATTAIIAFETWLFMWAPRNGHGLDSSLGFLLLPICLVLGGRIFLRTRVSRAQWFVVVLAGVAVTIKAVATPELGWVTAAVCLPFAIYFVGRTYLRLDTLAVFAVEMTLAAPVALVIISREGFWDREIGLLAVIGAASVVAMSAYVGASSLLPIPVFGLLSYVEPMLLVVVAILLGEHMHGADGVVYGILAVALALLAFAGFRDARRLPHLPGDLTEE